MTRRATKLKRKALPQTATAELVELGCVDEHENLKSLADLAEDRKRMRKLGGKEKLCDCGVKSSTKDK